VGAKEEQRLSPIPEDWWFYRDQRDLIIFYDTIKLVVKTQNEEL
jgi:hypothetical protein